ncbi:MAG: sodium:alanine symporter family protein [Ruminococcaceae bacterium]|nr:sodium:alanine symporter family protein [Oscillospiraceae bacterium]
MLKFLNDRVFGAILPVLLIAAGCYFLIRHRFFLLRHPFRILKAMLGEPGKRRSSFRAACVALSGTLGVGNIAGVAAAISAGGAGAVFWMWVCAFFAMVIKYVEVVTAMCFRRGGHGGPSYYIEKGLGKRWLGAIMAGIIILSSFGIGNIVQSSAAAEALAGCFSVPKLLTGGVFTVLILLLICGGVDRVSRFSSVVIPVLSLGYVVLSLAILIVNRCALPGVLRQIVSEAFAPGAVIGGTGGYLIGHALRYGASRGILSNEAGCGTAAYAHASADNEPVVQGFWGIFEVFVDTILLCSLTAFVVLTVNPGGTGNNGMELAVRAYSYVGEWGGAFIAISSAVYALASAVCWAYYGGECLTYLNAKTKTRRLYVFLYSATGILGAVMAPSFVWDISDLSISLMAICNTSCLCLLTSVGARETERYFSGKGPGQAPWRQILRPHREGRS